MKKETVTYSLAREIVTTGIAAAVVFSAYAGISSGIDYLKKEEIEKNNMKINIEFLERDLNEIKEIVGDLCISDNKRDNLERKIYE